MELSLGIKYKLRKCKARRVFYWFKFLMIFIIPAFIHCGICCCVAIRSSFPFQFGCSITVYWLYLMQSCRLLLALNLLDFYKQDCIMPKRITGRTSPARLAFSIFICGQAGSDTRNDDNSNGDCKQKN